MEDNITSDVGRDIVIYHRHLDHLESLKAIAGNAPQTFWELIGKSWVQDGRALLNAPQVQIGTGWVQYDILRIFIPLSFGSDEEAAQVLRMPFLDTMARANGAAS